MFDLFKMFKQLIKGSIYLTVVSLLIKLLSLIYTPILARLLGPAGFGTLNLVLITVTWFTTISLMGGEAIIARFIAEYRAKHYDIKDFIKRAVQLGVLSGVILTIIHLILSGIFATFLYNDPKLTSLVQLVSLLIVPSILFNLYLNSVRGFMRIGKYSKLLLCRQVLNTVIVLLLLFLFGATVINVVFGMIFALLLAALIGMHYVRKYWTGGETTKIDMKTYIKSAAFTFSLTIMVALVTQVDKLFVGRQLGNIAVGYYSAAIALTNAMQLVPSALSNWLMPFVGEAYGQKDWIKINIYLNKTLLHVMFFSSLLTLPIILFSDPITQLLFGTNYANASPILKILALNIPILAVTTLFNRYLGGLNKVHVYPKLNFISIPLLFLYPLTISRFGLYGAAITAVGISFILLLVYCIYMSRIISIRHRILKFGILSSIFIAIAVAISQISIFWRIFLSAGLLFIYGSVGLRILRREKIKI